ncbi:bifunctional hydroxymethylpyrimidine kinase/phosphomethylpyrimidine kinase [Synechococcus sp. MIT S1220]|uniref:bifunctional hydroxymethylpyrimidine kinase/phosphomethylpyrimidine kinase n=1 Tax=Synechococcus sp. MIT S1220 TaxID=3082549 RepID=UPI0039B111D6
MKIATALAIGGSDSSGGAGIQADLKAFNNSNVNGCSVITCATAQNTTGVTHVEALSICSIESQLNAILDDIEIASLKTGMLFSTEIIELISFYLDRVNVPKIIDPVMISRAGSQLIDSKAVDSYKKFILPKAFLLTPNIYEASLLSEINITSKKDIEHSARKILEFGMNAIVVKCGALETLSGQDYFLDKSGDEFWLSGQRIYTKHTHGSGCTFAAAITACLSKQIDLQCSIKLAKEYVTECIRHSLNIGQGAGPICQWKDVVCDYKI